MATKRSRPQSFADVVASLPERTAPDSGETLSPAGGGELVDADGRRWRKVRGPLLPPLVRRLATRADRMIVGEGGGSEPRDVPADARLAEWQAMKGEFDSACADSHRAYEFASEDGDLTLLYVEVSC